MHASSDMGNSRVTRNLRIGGAEVLKGQFMDIVVAGQSGERGEFRGGHTQEILQAPGGLVNL
jgi:hypothetical protein